MNFSITKLLNYSITFSFLFLANTVFADELVDPPIVDLTIQDVLDIFTGLACWLSDVALVLIVIAIIYYGIKFMMVQSDPKKLDEAKKSFQWGLVGIAVIAGTYTIIASVAYFFGADYTLFIPLLCY